MSLSARRMMPAKPYALSPAMPLSARTHRVLRGLRDYAEEYQRAQAAAADFERLARLQEAGGQVEPTLRPRPAEFPRLRLVVARP